jgi:hypothetical protein
MKTLPAATSLKSSDIISGLLAGTTAEPLPYQGSPSSFVNAEAYLVKTNPYSEFHLGHLSLGFVFALWVSEMIQDEKQEFSGCGFLGCTVHSPAKRTRER